MTSNLEHILADGRWTGPHGIGRFSKEVLSRLPIDTLSTGLRVLHPLEPIWLTVVLAKRNPRLFFSPGFNAPVWSPVPFVFTIHDLIHLRMPTGNARLYRAYYDSIVRPGALRSKFILTGSHYSKEEILEFTGLPEDRVVVVGNGVGEGFSPDGPKYDPGYPYLFYIGNRKPHKNIARLIAAFAASGLQTSFRLLLSGDPDPDVVRLIKEHGVHRGVTFAGQIPEGDLAGYYRGASALVFPSLYEGFGLPPLESMACGTPVVTSNVTSLPEVVGSAAILIDPRNVESIAFGLRQSVENTLLRSQLRQLGLARAKQFGWDLVTNRVSLALRRAVDAR